MTQLSRSETESLILKASAGAGLDWGLAEEAAVSAGWLSARGLPWAPAFVACLEPATRGSPRLRPGPTLRVWRTRDGGPACPVTLGAALCDFATLAAGNMRLGALDLGPVVQPLVLVPFAALLAAEAGRSVALNVTGAGVVVTPEGDILGDVATLIAMAQVHLSLSLTDANPPRCAVVPATLQLADLHRLEALALNTTVPPSALSRSGAGAIGSDND